RDTAEARYDRHVPSELLLRRERTEFGIVDRLRTLRLSSSPLDRLVLAPELRSGNQGRSFSKGEAYAMENCSGSLRRGGLHRHGGDLPRGGSGLIGAQGRRVRDPVRRG